MTDEPLAPPPLHELEAWPKWLQQATPEGHALLVERLRSLRADAAAERGALEDALEHARGAELKLDALELDAQRVHQFLDEFEVPRFGSASAQGGERPMELSLLGRVALVLGEDEQ